MQHTMGLLPILLYCTERSAGVNREDTSATATYCAKKEYAYAD